MRILMSLALGLACTAGAFAADDGTTPGVGGDQVSATSPSPINTIDPVTGKTVDASLPAVLVPNASQASGSSSGMAGDASATGSASGAGEPQWVAIGISEQSSAERIRANPQRYLQAARLNLKAHQDGLHSGSSSGLDSGSGSTSDWNQAGQSPSVSGSDQTSTGSGFSSGDSASDPTQAGQSPSVSGAGDPTLRDQPALPSDASSPEEAGQSPSTSGQNSSSSQMETEADSSSSSSDQSSGSSPGMEGRPGDAATDDASQSSGSVEQPQSAPAPSAADSDASLESEGIPAEPTTGSGSDLSEPSM